MDDCARRGDVPAETHRIERAGGCPPRWRRASRRRAMAISFALLPIACNGILGNHEGRVAPDASSGSGGATGIRDGGGDVSVDGGSSTGAGGSSTAGTGGGGSSTASGGASIMDASDAMGGSFGTG